MTENTRDDVVVSFKAHTGYDSPFIAIKGATAAEVADKIGAMEATGLFAIIGKADTAIKAHFNVGAVLGATPVQHPSSVPTTGYAPPVPQIPSQPVPVGPPGMTAPTCPHGTKLYKTSKPGANKSWKAYMCPAAQGTPGQCPPEWL